MAGVRVQRMQIQGISRALRHTSTKHNQHQYQQRQRQRQNCWSQAIAAHRSVMLQSSCATKTCILSGAAHKTHLSMSSRAVSGSFSRMPHAHVNNTAGRCVFLTGHSNLNPYPARERECASTRGVLSFASRTRGNFYNGSTHVTSMGASATRLVSPRNATSASGADAGSTDLVQMIHKKNTENPIMIYSKTYCPFCSQVKSVLSSAVSGNKATGPNDGIVVIELDNLADGAEVQNALLSITGMRTVPQVFIGGKIVGGCDDTIAMKQSGQLDELISNAFKS